MKGLVIWAHDNCRSTLGFYIELVKTFDVPAIINIVHKIGVSQREKVGFKSNELLDDKIKYIEDDVQKALKDLQKHSDWNHLFASYQKNDIFRVLIDYAIKKKIRYAIMSEAPCNMEATPMKRFLKSIYINKVLRYKLKDIYKHADFIVNYSGYYERALNNIGWNKSQIISCGYYPPPIPESHLVKRDQDNWKDFTILLSGIHQWHRSPMVLLKALLLLSKRGLKPKCYITQEGPLLNKMKNFAYHNHLDNIAFLGFVSMEKLIELYETCSVYVGAGAHEPWGMRLNDVLQCGAPLIVSRGMGGVKMVDEYQCGLAFSMNDFKGLASSLEFMIKDEHLYIHLANNAYNAAKSVSPYRKAIEIVSEIQRRYPENWL